MLTRIPLDPTWRLRAVAGPAPIEIVDREFDAPVPGDVHTALERAGAIPDPVIDNNEQLLRWIGETSWEYSTRLPGHPELTTAECIEVVFHGVDTIARADINGEPRASSRNMHRTWRAPAPEVADGGGRLTVTLESPIEVGDAERRRLGDRWSVFSPISPFLRKKACDFGWDWGPSLPGAGIWRTAEIQAWSTARIDALRPTARLVDGDGVVEVDLDLVRSDAGRSVPLEIVVTLGETSVTIPVSPGETRIRGEVVVASPALWWPVGLGPQSLHTLVVSVRAGGVVLDERTQKIGFRDLVVDQEPDSVGVSFGITVNGERMFIRGFNWIPDDTSVALVTERDYRQRIAEAQALGANLIRVWGGGVFEDDAFYNACDEAGMLVWQDFLFACAAYPEEEPFTEEVEAEARDNVSRLMHHASLAIWNGNNENLWFWFLHDWQTVLEGRSWGEGFYFDVLPRVVADLDPARTYIVGSPSSGDRWTEPNDPSRGVVHSWVPDDFRAYDLITPRFVSEFGFQGPPARATFDAAVHDVDPAPFSPGTIQRQKAEGGTERINDVLDIHFGVPADFDEWYWLAQLNQAHAVRYGIERFRVLEPLCRGTVVWQLNDCWPSLSWSVIDVEDRWKPVAYSVREAYRDRIVVLRIEDGVPVLYGCNSTNTEWDVSVEVQRWRGGEWDATTHVSGRIAPHSASVLPLGDLGRALAADELLVATAPDTRSVVLGQTDREFPFVEPDYGVDVSYSSGAVAVTVTARSLIRDATLPVADVDPAAHSDVNVVTLLPGESATWTIRTAQPSAFDEGTVRGILKSAHAASSTDPSFRSLAMLEAEKAARRAATSA